jgi:hypothetical protein
MFFVFFISAQILTCDLPGSDCSVLSTSDKHLPPSAPDNCICCCAHPLIVAPVTPVFAAIIIPVADEPPVLRPISRTLEIEHPPQLS